MPYIIWPIIGTRALGVSPDCSIRNLTVVLESVRPGEGSPEAFAKIRLNEHTKLSTLIKTIGMKLH